MKVASTTWHVRSVEVTVVYEVARLKINSKFTEVCTWIKCVYYPSVVSNLPKNSVIRISGKIKSPDKIKALFLF
jgi:hypothetical protein